MDTLCVLTRAPAPGAGKSRLRPLLGDAATDRLVAALLNDVIAWSESPEWRLLVMHAGPAGSLEVTIGPDRLVPQVEGDLGARISAAVDGAFARGAGRVVIVGSDCPTLPSRLLEAAFRGLRTASSTLVPADDGGWIALGVVRPLGHTLDGVAWGTELAGEQTVAALAADGRAPLLLAPWYDIDEPADLERARRDPDLGGRAPRTMAVLEAMASASV